MALVKYAGTGATSISGKIGGTVFTPGGSAGAFIRNWTKPRNARTALQQLVRGVLSGISSAWRGLTATQISNWNQAAHNTGGYGLRHNRMADTRYMSGAQVFQKINNILLSIGQAVSNNPPGIPASVDAITAVTVTPASAGPTFTIDLTLFSAAGALPANTYAKIYATNQKSNGVSFFGKSQYRFIGYFSPTDSVTGMDILTMYTNVFGALNSGTKISVAAELVYTDGGGHFNKTGQVFGLGTVS